MNQKSLFAQIASAHTLDAAAREAAWDVEQSWIVEAPAGSGKTELLMQRFLRLLARVEAPEQVLAITFTRKAAAEMRARIVESLREAEANETLPEEAPHKQQTRKFALEAMEQSRRMGWSLISQPQRLNIRTIDSLCSEITGRMPILSGLGAEMRPIENASRLYREAAQETLEELGGKDARLQDAICALLLHLDNKMERAIGLIASMLSTRDQWGRIFPIQQDLTDAELNIYIYKRLEVPLQQIAEQTLTQISTQLPADTWQEIFSLGHFAAQQLEHSSNQAFVPLLVSPSLPNTNAEELPRWQAAARLLLTQEETLRKPRGIDVRIGFPPGHPLTIRFKTFMKALQGDSVLESAAGELLYLPPVRYTEQQKTILCASFFLLRRAIAHLKLAFARTGTADFVEISMAAYTALRENAESIAMAFGTHIQHLLVDEMQDTSITQFNLLSELVKSWDGYSQTVFLVGDPKQSIYRFRHVEAELFARARRDGLGGVLLQPLHLSRNFRSRQSLVEQSNILFNRLFEDRTEITFQPSVAAHEEPSCERIFWHPYIQPYKPDSLAAADPCAQEAYELCDVIDRHRKSSASGNPPSIAILIRARTHVGTILEEMRRRGIPYRAVEMDTLPNRQSTLDLMTITRCLLHPADRIAWLAALRAPWCGLTLRDLLALCGEDDAAWKGHTVMELFHERAGAMSEDGRIRARRTLQILFSTCQGSTDERLSIQVERAWRSLGGPQCLPSEELNSAAEFFRMLDALEDEEEGWPSAAKLEERANTLFAPVSIRSGFAVEVLTLHKAKGLEWDVVLIPGLHRQPRRDTPTLVQWMEDISSSGEVDSLLAEAPRVFLAPIRHAAEEQEPIGSWIARNHRRRNLAELKRLVYVGCTRARQEVHLFAQCETTKSGELAEPGQATLLHTIWPVGQTVFEEHRMRTSAAAPGNVVSMPGAQPSAVETGILDTVAASQPNSKETHIALSNFRRLPSDWRLPTPAADIAVPTILTTVEASELDESHLFERPQGSWQARLFGTTLHAFLEPLAKIVKMHSSDFSAVKALQELRGAISLHLQREGYATPQADTEAGRVLNALEQMAKDATGRWILLQPPATEFQEGFEIPFNAYYKGALRSVRVDRIFRAGASPLQSGKECLWIVDFKTASHSAGQLEAFLSEQQEQYTAQMQTYAEMVQAVLPDSGEIRLGLYYPLIPRLLWWPFQYKD